MLSVAKTESRFNSVALSEKGAFGLMQLTPATAKRFKVDLRSHRQCARWRALPACPAEYRNPFYILAAYNAGEDAVEKNRGVGLPPRPCATSPRSSTTSTRCRHPRGLQIPRRRPNARAAWNDGFVMHID